MFKVFWISNIGDYSVCGNNIDANVSFAPLPQSLPSRGRDKVCHPELVSGSKLAANHTSPYPLLLRRGKYSLYKSRRLKVFESFLIIFKKATFQSVEIMLMQTFRLPPSLNPSPHRGQSDGGREEYHCA